MTFNEYQRRATATALYPKHDTYGAMYLGLGLGGETGEVLELLKKAYRSGQPVDTSKLKLELGDVLWYLSQLAQEYGLELEGIAKANIAKLTARKANNTLRENHDHN